MGVGEAGGAGHDARVDADEEEDEVLGDHVAEEADWVVTIGFVVVCGCVAILASASASASPRTCWCTCMTPRW